MKIETTDAQSFDETFPKNLLELADDETAEQVRELYGEGLVGETDGRLFLLRINEV